MKETRWFSALKLLVRCIHININWKTRLLSWVVYDQCLTFLRSTHHCFRTCYSIYYTWYSISNDDIHNQWQNIELKSCSLMCSLWKFLKFLNLKKISQVHQEWSYRLQITLGLEQKTEFFESLSLSYVYFKKKSFGIFFITHSLKYCCLRCVVKNWWLYKNILKHTYSRMFRQEHYKDKVCRER